MYTQEQGLYIAHGTNGPIVMNGKKANRHGLIAGATGTGKTVSLQVIAESFCPAGGPCFMADMKGDLSGISQVGKRSERFGRRQTDDAAQTLFHFPIVADVGAIHLAAGSRRPASAKAGFLLRRGPHAVQGNIQGTP